MTTSKSMAVLEERHAYLIRKFEEGAEDLYTRGLSYGTMHLSVGQEATAVGATMMLRKSDYITSTHRGHGHCIGKGAEVKYMFAEFLGKEEGYCRGRGGSHPARAPTHVGTGPRDGEDAARRGIRQGGGRVVPAVADGVEG